MGLALWARRQRGTLVTYRDEESMITLQDVNSRVISLETVQVTVPRLSGQKS